MLHVLLFAFLIGIPGLLTGMLLGRLWRDLELRNGLQVSLQMFRRIARKKWLRSGNPGLDAERIRRDEAFLSLAASERAERVDSQAVAATGEMKRHLSELFVGQIEAVYLFGSRVRGDHQPDSDVDVCVFLAEAVACSDAHRKALHTETVRLLLSYGLYLQPRIIEHQLRRDPSTAYLVQLVTSYGVPV